MSHGPLSGVVWSTHYSDDSVTGGSNHNDASGPSAASVLSSSVVMLAIVAVTCGTPAL